MKNNAMFLLELSGASSRTMKTSPPDMNTCFSNTGPLQCLHSLGVHPAMIRDDGHFPQDEHMYRHESDIMTTSRVCIYFKKFLYSVPKILYLILDNF